MKKVFTFFLAMAIIFGISGCGKKEYIVFPFSASDVVKIETYYSNSEADTKEKTLTEEADIDYLYTVLVKLFGNTLFGNHALYRNSIGVI